MFNFFPQTSSNCQINLSVFVKRPITTSAEMLCKNVQVQSCQLSVSSLCDKVRLQSLYSRSKEHWYIFLQKAILNDVPLYLYSILSPQVVIVCNLWSSRQNLIVFPFFGSSTLSVFALLFWPALQNHLKLENCVNLDCFKTRSKDHLMSLCACFMQLIH